MHDAPTNWEAIRRGREFDGKNWSELARLHGVSRNRITRRARREGWREPGEILRKATDDFARRLVAREGEAVPDNLRHTLALTDRVRSLAQRLLDRLESDAEFRADELKTVAEIVRKTHAVEAHITGIGDRDQGWRSEFQETAEKERRASHDEAIRRALDSLKEDSE